MTELAIEMGVKATPTFFVGAEQFTGVVDIDKVKRLLGLT